MGQRLQTFGRQRSEQLGAGEQERRATDHLQQQSEDKTHTLLEVQAQPDNQQTAGGPHRTRRLPRQDKQHRQIDQRQTGQQHHRQTAQQAYVAAHHFVASGQKHAGDQRQANQGCAEQTAPTGTQYRRRIFASALQPQQEQRTAEQLHSERGEQERARLQPQAYKQGRQTGQRPTDRRALDEEEQRRQQIKERQPQARQYRQPLAFPRRSLLRRGVAQLIEAEQQRRAEHQRAQWSTIEQASFADIQLAEKRQRRTELQQQRKGPGERSMLTQAQPENPCALHRPCRRRPACIKAQRNRQAGENHPECQTGFAEQHRAPAHQHFGQAHVNHAQRQGTECGGELKMLDQRKLQPEAHDGRAEQHRSVNVIALARRPVQQRLAITVRRSVGHIEQFTPGKQQADGEVHQEEQNQEWLGAPQ